LSKFNRGFGAFKCKVGSIEILIDVIILDLLE
jgi:hypothetical protein